MRQRTLVYVLGLAAKIKPAYQVFFVLATRNHGRILHLADCDDAALPIELDASCVALPAGGGR